MSVWASIAAGTTAAGQKQGPGGDFDRIAKQAAAASEQNRLDEAAGMYRKALALRPKWAEGWWSLGTLDYERDRYAEAARAFRRLVALAPKNGTARVMLGLCEFELGQDAEALKHIQQGDSLGVMNNDQLRRVALYHEGILLLRAGKYGSALKPLKAVCEAGVQSKDLVQSVGLAVFGLKPNAAPPQGTPGRQVVARAGQAECLQAQKQSDSARKEYESLLAEYPEYPNLHFVYGRFLLELHETDGAVEQFKAELKNNPRHLNSLLEIAAVRYRSDSADGVKYAQEAVALAPKLPFAHYLLGLLLVDTGKAAEALPELEIARRAYPNEPSVYFALGNAYARTGRKSEAARTRATFLRLNAEGAKQPGETVYGEEPSGLTRDKLRTGPQGGPQP